MNSGVVGFIFSLLIALCSSDDKDAKIRFYFSSLENFKELSLSFAQDIMSTGWYNASRNTVVFCHGYTGNPDGPASTSVMKAYLERGESNVALLNWDHLAANTMSSFPGSYISWAAPNARQLGIRFAETVANLSDAGINLNNLLLIGHSLGAHVFGITGNNLRLSGILLPRIIGLDPAALGFENKHPPLRLNPGSASVVTVVHTDPSKYGCKSSMGTVDFWPNFRHLAPVRQPGCPNGPTTAFSNEDLCNHHRSWQLLVDSIKYPGSIIGSHARNYKAWKRYTQQERNAITLSLDSSLDNAKRGNFFLITNSESPYGLGLNGL